LFFSKLCCNFAAKIRKIMSESVKYPVGVQDFEKVRTGGYLYIDKTVLIYKLVNSGSYYFISRPRRFGKSLLVSTLSAYFQGKKNLFEGLAIEKLEKEWKRVPVFHLDLNTSNYDSKEALLNLLNDTVTQWEREYGSSPTEKTPDLKFKGVIQRAYEQTGERVAILIDEYDKPLLQNIGNDDLQEELRSILRSFYSVIKTKDSCIRFGLLTGVTKFGKLSVFSDLNSPDDISISRDWATLCGITEEELCTQLTVGINEMAEANGMTHDETLARLKKKYDGYHFHQNTEGVYNPFSLLCALRKREFEDYWFETGTPSFLVTLLKQSNYNLNNLVRERQTADNLNSIANAELNPVPMLYQSGYLTIKGYDERFRKYLLGFPNEEVEIGFISFLLPCYVRTTRESPDFFVEQFVEEVESGDVNNFLKRLQTMFADNSYTIQGDKELYYQNTMFVIFKMMGFYVDIERTTSYGRIDMVIKTNDNIYVIEIKLDGTADEALKQIEDKGYAAPYAMDKRKLYKIGINFSSDIRGISEWKIAE